MWFPIVFIFALDKILMEVKKTKKKKKKNRPIFYLFSPGYGIRM